MQLYFTVNSVPELAALPEPIRRAIWQRCHPKAWRHWETWLAIVICMAFLSAGFYLAVFAQPDHSLYWGHMVFGLLGFLIGSAGFFPVHVAMARRYIAAELAK